MCHKSLQSDLVLLKDMTINTQLSVFQESKISSQQKLQIKGHSMSNSFYNRNIIKTYFQILGWQSNKCK